MSSSPATQTIMSSDAGKQRDCRVWNAASSSEGISRDRDMARTLFAVPAVPLAIQMAAWCIARHGDQYRPAMGTMKMTSTSPDSKPIESPHHGGLG